MIHGTQLLLAVREFVNVSSRLKTKVFKHLKRCLRSQHIDIKHARVKNEVVRVVVLVHDNRQTQRIACHLLHRVDDAAVVDVVVVRRQDIKTVSYLKKGLGIHV